MGIKTIIHLASGDSFTCELDGNMKLTKNLRVSEVANNEAKEDIKLEIYPLSWKCFELFQFCRDHRGKAITVNSNYRTPTYNAACGGDKNSLHLKGYAIDISIPYEEQEPFIDWVYLFTLKEGLTGGVNRYEKFFHMDVAENEFGYKDFVIRDYTKKTRQYRPYE